MASLPGKVVLVTGAAGGFGKAFVSKFLNIGCKVCLCDINKEAGQEAAQIFSSQFGPNRVKFSVCDVSSDSSFRGAFKTCLEEFGQVDILINNAGVANDKDFKQTIEINMCGTIRGTEIAMEYMSKTNGYKGGRVINISSIIGVKDIPFLPFYAASKSGVVQYTRVMGHPFHLDYSGVIVQCLCPGLTETPFIALDPKRIYNTQCEAVLKSEFGKIKLLNTNEIAESMIKLIEDNKPGAVMVVEKDKDPYYVEPALSM